MYAAASQLGGEVVRSKIARSSGRRNRCVSEHGKGRQKPEYKLSHCHRATLRPCRRRCRTGSLYAVERVKTRALISVARLATSLLLASSSLSKTRTRFKRGDFIPTDEVISSQPNSADQKVVNDYSCLFPRLDRSAPPISPSFPSYDETYVTHATRRVG